MSNTGENQQTEKAGEVVTEGTVVTAGTTAQSNAAGEEKVEVQSLDSIIDNLSIEPVKAIREVPRKARSLGELLDEKLGRRKDGDQAKDFEIIPVASGMARIRLIDPKLREFLHYCTESGHVHHNWLEQSSDDAAIKMQRTRMSVIPLSQLIGDLEDFENINQEFVESSASVAWDVWSKFVEAVKAAHAETHAQAENAMSQGEMNFSQLMTLLNVPGRYMAYRHGEKIIGFMTRRAQMQSSMFTGPYLAVEGTNYVHTGKELTKARVQFNVPMYDGVLPCSEFGVWNLSADKDLCAQLLERGKKYVALTEKPMYVKYEGILQRKNWWHTAKFNAKGRIMIDLAGMRSTDPEYRMYYGLDVYRDRDEAEQIDIAKIPDEHLMCMSPYLYGFSFTQKVWGEMDIDGVSEISFRQDAYDMLVLDKDTKDIVFSLVDTDYRESNDFIDGKGGGCIFLLAGPPGVGKTLTAEAISEKLQRPLYTVSVGELGTDVAQLEQTLRQILDVANSWNAVLLIDEADIFLEARNDLDIERNAMVGVFLRLLEYYPGILFLTTNRASNIDEAFFSRISMSIHYEGLAYENRKIIWGNLVKLYKLDVALDIDSLAKHELNGRQIKNILRNSAALAKSEGVPLGIEHLNRVINKALAFEVHKKNVRKLEG